MPRIVLFLSLQTCLADDMSHPVSFRELIKGKIDFERASLKL